jgi:pyruvate formate lyase activating enzyme
MLDKPRTPASTLRKAREIGLEARLEHVYEGNIPGEEGENTFCSSCGKKIIDRSGFFLRDMRMKEGKCDFCGEVLPGIWE